MEKEQNPDSGKEVNQQVSWLNNITAWTGLESALHVTADSDE